MKRYNLWVLIFLFVPFFLGMGQLIGEESPDKVPVPDKFFQAVFVDQMDTVVVCTDVTIMGRTFVEGKQGEGLYTIPFDKIRNVLFLLNNGQLQGVINLKDGNTMNLIMDKDHKAYGRTSYGTFQIKLSHLKKITLQDEGVSEQGE